MAIIQTGRLEGDQLIFQTGDSNDLIGDLNPNFQEVTNNGNVTTGDIGVSGDINVGTITMLPPPSGGFVDAARKLYWDEDVDTLSIGMNGEVTLQVGQEQYYYVKAAETISNGDVIYASGVVGGSTKIIGAKYIANNTIDELYVLGIATQDISVGEFGYVTQFGTVRSIVTTGQNGETWNEGDILYASPTVYGGLTNVEPVAPNLDISMAIITNEADDGAIFVRPTRNSHLDELHDVHYPTTPAINELLRWGSSARWENVSLSSGNGIDISNTSSDISISHSDTSSQSSVDNSNGTVIQDISLDTFGHVTSIGSSNLDDRYYTEGEIDAKVATKAVAGGIEFAKIDSGIESGMATIPVDPANLLFGNYSFSLYVKFNEFINTVVNIVGGAPIGDAGRIGLSLSYNGNLIFSERDGTTSLTGAATDSPLSLDTWYHISAIATSKTYKLYINGVEQTATGIYQLMGENIGSYLYFNERPVSGESAGISMRDFRIFNRALSAAEVADLYESGTVAVEDRWGAPSQTFDFESGISGITTENGFGSAISIAANSSSPISGIGDMLVTVTTAGTAGSYPRIIIPTTVPFESLKVGGQYKLKFKTKVVSGSPVISYFCWDNASAGDGAIGEPSNLALSGTQTHEYTFTQTRFRLPTDAKFKSLSIGHSAAGEYQIDDIIIEPLGCIADLPLDEGIGTNFYDLSPNNFDATGSSTGITHLIPANPPKTLNIIKEVDGAGSALDADLLDGQHGSYYQPASSALTASTNFGGDISGPYNNIVVANDSHTHDTRYYTEDEVDAKVATKATAGGVAIGETAAKLDIAGSLNVRSFAFWYKPLNGHSGTTFSSLATSNSLSTGRFALGHFSTTNIGLALANTSGTEYSIRFEGLFDTYLNEWIHIACVDTGSNLELYINGTLQTPTSTSGNYPTMDWADGYASIGGYNGSGSGLSKNGQFGTTRIFNRALSAAEVADLYESGTVAVEDRWGFDKEIDQSFSTWTQSNITSLTGGHSDPDGGTDAELITIAASGASLTYTAYLNEYKRRSTLYAKAGTLSDLRVRIGGSSPELNFTVDLTDGSTSVAANSTDSFSIDVVDVGSSWWKITAETYGTLNNNFVIVFNINASAADTIYLYSPKAEVLGAIADLPLDEGIGTNFYDLSPNNFDATGSSTGITHLIPANPPKTLNIIKEVDGAGSALDADLLDGQHGSYYQPASSALTTSTNFGGDVSGTFDNIIITDNSHNHIISNVDGLQTALDGKLGTSEKAADSDKLDGYDSSEFTRIIPRTITNVDSNSATASNKYYEIGRFEFGSMQGLFIIDVNFSGGGTGNSARYELPVTYQMDYLLDYGISFTNGQWHNISAIFHSPRHFYTHASDWELQAKPNNNSIDFRIVIREAHGSGNSTINVAITHNANFVGATYTELTGTGTDATVYSIIPCILSGLTGSSIIGNDFNLIGDFKASNIGTGEDNSVVVLNPAGYLKTDEIDSRVWGSSLVDGNGTSNSITKWSDGNTITDSSITDNGSTVTILNNNSFTSAGITTNGFLRGPSSFIIDPSAHGDDSGTVVIAGNLQVDGTTTTVNSTTVEVGDKNIVLGSNATNNSQNDGAGLTVTRPEAGSISATILWNETNGEWDISNGLTVASNRVLTTADEGSGNGLDADTLDGYESSYFYPASNPNGYTTNVGTVTSITAGGGLSGGTITTAGTISHDNTSSQSSVDNSNGTVIQDISLDTYGHVTSIGSSNLDDRYYTEDEVDAKVATKAVAGGVEFDGTSGYISIPYVDFSDQDYTLYARISSNDLATGTILIYGRAGSGRQWTRLGYDSSNGWEFAFDDNVSLRRIYGGLSTAGKTVSLVGVRNGSTLKIYVDGKEIDSYTGTLGSLTNVYTDSYIGVTNSNSTLGDFFNGKVLECMTFNRALSASEVAELYESGTVAVADRWGFDKEIDQSFSTWNQTNITSITGGQSDPDGGTDAELITVSSTSGRVINTIWSGEKYRRQTIYAKAGTSDGHIDVRMGGLSPEVFVRWQLTDFSYSTIQDSTGSADVSVTDMGSGWYKMVITALNAGSLNNIFGIYFGNIVAGETVYLYSPKAEVLGAIADLPLDEGIGTNFYDLSPNNFDATGSSTGITHLIPANPPKTLNIIKEVDGAGSALDADLLDGQHGSYYLPAAGKAADSNLLDGLDSSQFLRSDADDTMSGNLILSDNKGISSETQNGSLRVINPGGASYATTASIVTGSIKITLPQSWSNTMMRMTIKVYEYASDASFTIECGGYNYTSSSWYRTFAQIRGSYNANRDYNVRFGHDGSKCCIYIGETNQNWNYPQVAVTEFQAGYQNFDANSWDDNWDVSFTQTLGTITSTVSSTDKVRYAADSDKLDGLDSSQFLRSDSADSASADITLTNSADLRFQDTNGTFPTTAGGFQWVLNNDSARIYAQQPSSDFIDFFFKITDNAGSTDRFVFWIDDYRGSTFDKYPAYFDGSASYLTVPVDSNGDINLSSARLKIPFGGDCTVDGNKILTTADEGSGNGLDADTLDGYQGTYYQPASSALTTSTTFGGDVSGLYNNIVIADDSHTHDARYYTETEVQTFLNRSYISNENATNLPQGWYTIATNIGNRATARFGIWDQYGGRHQSVTFYAAHNYGSNSSNTLTILDNSYYSGNPFRYIRIKDGGTYDGAVLQIYIDDSSNNVFVAILGDNFQSSGWVLRDWIPDATTPPDVSNYGSFVEVAKVDLNNIAQGGFATTGPIYADGDLTQYKVLTTADEGSGNGLDADTLDGYESSYFYPASSIIGTDNYVPRFNGTSALENSIIYDNGTNIGIGTTSPSKKLDVQGNAIVNYNGAAGLTVKNSSASGPSEIYFDQTASSASQRAAVGMDDSSRNFFVWIDGSDRLNIDTSGNVGIGTTSPSEKLHVNGNAYINGTIYANNIGAGEDNSVVILDTDGKLKIDEIDSRVWGSSLIDGNGTANYISKWSDGNTQTNSIVYDNGTNVGVGTTSPITRVHIYGTEITSSSETTASPVLRLSRDITDPSLPGRKDSAVDFVLSRQEEITNNYPYTRFDIRLSSPPTYGGADSNAPSLDVMSLLYNGNVGIGTTSPSEKLHVNGNAYINGTIYADNIGAGEDNSVVILDSDGKLKIDEIDSRVWGSSLIDGNGTANYISKWSDGNTQTNSLVYDNGTNVGVGTTSPQANLDINGSSLSDIGLQIRAGDINTGTDSSQIVFSYNGASYNSIGYAHSIRTRHDSNDKTNNAIDFYVWNQGVDSSSTLGSKRVMTIDGHNLGTVGIGTSSPTSAPLVINDTNISSLITFAQSGTSTARAFVGYDGVAARFGGGAGKETRIFSNDIQYVTIQTDGDVGIGTTTPGYKLEVNGSFAATTKSFVIDHPTKEGKKLRYASLEGPENGVYIRGKSGADIIELPEYWEKLVDSDSVTVTLTPIGKFQPLYVISQDSKKIEIGGVEGEYNYVIYGERIDVEKLIVEVD